MPEYMINGIPVMFPFEPYNVQRAYMEKVIDCLEQSTHGVLESPTGTGKTLSLLCSALAWTQRKKQQVETSIREQLGNVEQFNMEYGIDTSKLPGRKQLVESLVQQMNGPNSNQNTKLGVPRIIYSSRTHSQISQAMQELKRTGYNHVKAAVIGSRDQLCIHPDLAKETNANKIQICKIKVKSRTCHFHNRLEGQKDNPEFRNASVLDIEDIVRIGKKLKCCPYYASKELLDDAEIIFMPYNYLLDPKMRKANKIELQNTIVILDEAHNVEKMCEESASATITSTQIALAIEDVTHVLAPMVANEGSISNNPSLDTDETPDFTVDDLTLLKEILLNLEKSVDNIQLSAGSETKHGGYIFSILEQANINVGNSEVIIKLLDTLIQYCATNAEANQSVFRRGAGLQHMQDFLTIVFSGSSDEFRSKVNRCYKVYIEPEPQKPTRGNQKQDNGWIQTKAIMPAKLRAKSISYWCFSPGFGMQHLLGRNVRSIILTSGTLAPLKPLITELDIPIAVRLENPHIVNKSQVCVKIIGQGSDKETLNSNFQNRDNVKYINSLGRTIAAFCPVVPDGLLVFFPSYGILNKCKASWQESGVWSSIERTKQIFVEPQTKDAFVTTMTDYYARISDPNTKGACFMAVCRGKVSEGLDFADMNGRAVIITGLPFPPYMDPKVRLKKQYLSENRTRENEMLSGDDWYFLEASRAVNQAIGRVIRHKNDYGAILLCDTRFHNPRQKNQLSGWLQNHLREQQPGQPFGSVIGEVARFFREAERTLPKPGLKPISTEEFAESSKPSGSGFVTQTSYSASSSTSNTSKSKYFDQSSSSSNQSMRSTDLALEKLPRASDTFSLEQYKKAGGPMLGGKVDLFSGLNQTVKSINFNNISSDSLSDVTIHKRNRESEDLFSQTSSIDSQSTTISDIDAPKKKKYKLVPNSYVSPPSKIEPISASVSTKRSPENSINTANVSEKVLPKDRKELLLFVKNTLNNEKYRAFLKVFLDYNNNKCYQSFKTGLFEVFNEPQWFYILKGMNRFTRTTDRDTYEKDVARFMASFK